MADPAQTAAQEVQPPSPQAADAASSSQPRFITKNPFRRSSASFTGGGVLARLASSNSTRTQPPSSPEADPTAEPRQRRPSIGRRISSRTSRKSSDGITGANLAELSKPNGKFKSGIKWDSQQVPEPFMEASDSTAAERELAATIDVQAALASGSTAAAQAHAQSRGIGQPIFQHRSSSSSTSPPASTSPRRASSQLPTVSQTISALGSSGIHPDILGTATSSTMAQDPSSTPSVPANGVAKDQPENEADALRGDGATPCMTPPAKSREASHSEQGALNGDNHMVARAAQLVLEAARQKARVETRKKGKSAPASPKRIAASLSPITTQDNAVTEDSPLQSNEADTELARTPSQRARSKSDAGGEAQIKKRKSFLRSMSSRTRRNKSDTSNGSEDGSETPTPAPSSPTIGSGTSSGTATPGGRRRRYADTRDLDLLARELAAEAIAEQVPQPPFARASRSGSSSPHRTKTGPGAFNDPRRRSFPSILEDAPLQDDSITPLPAAANGLKPMTPLAPSRPNARARAADGRSMAGIGAAKAAPGLSPDPTNGMVPKEMFLGLGGSPYPSLPPPTSRSASMTLDNMDPFGIPLTQESSPFDATLAYANKTQVYHTPNQVAMSRSHSGASTWSASQTSPNNKRRPVLTMTMNDPQSELQGLTKPPKEGKRLTPFGSRASSRAPSPSPSFTNLKQAAAAQKPSTDEGTAGAGDGAQSDAVIPSVNVTDLAAVTTDEAAPDAGEGRRDSMAPSERSTRPSLAPSRPNRIHRLSTLFRSNRSKTQVDTVSSVKAESNQASTTTSPELSAYATPSAETVPPTLSPQSIAVSADSDADVSPVAFRTVDLPSTQDAPRRSRPSSTNASRRSSMALDSVERPAQKKRPIRAFLRRLSSFSSKNDKQANSAKANFPDAATMPVVDTEKLKQLSKTEDVQTDAATDPSEPRVTEASEVRPPDETVIESGLVPAIQGLDLSNASPAPVHEEMAKNGFGTRSAYKLGGGNGGDSKQADAVEGDGPKEVAVLEDKTAAAPSTEDEAAEQDKELGREDGWERSRPAQIARTDSQTPSSEDSFFLGSGHSTLSRPGSGALMKHGSESAISEELHTPDPSTAHLPQTKVDEVMLEEDALSSTVSSVSAAAAAAAAAKVMATAEGNGPVVTAVPTDEAKGLIRRPDGPKRRAVVDPPLALRASTLSSSIFTERCVAALVYAIMLHHSCARCRLKKIRCDGASPCANCVDCGVASECKRLLRKVRSKRPSSNHNASIESARIAQQRQTAPSSSPRRGSTSSNSAIEHERHQAQEGRWEDSRSPPSVCNASPRYRTAGSSASHRTPSTSGLQTPGFAAPVPRADSGASPSIRPPSSSPALTYHLRGAGGSISGSSESIRSRRADDSLLKKARDTIGDHDAAQRIIDMHFYYRCSSVINSCVHVPTLKATLRRLFSPEVASDLGQDELALVLMALAMAIQYAPRAGGQDGMPRCDQLGDDLTPKQRQHALHALGASILERIAFGATTTLAQLQACILVIVYDLDSDGYKQQMLLHAMRCAETLGLDHIRPSAPLTVEHEMGVRAWWFLVCRDWFAAPQKSSYRVHPEHFTTRLPLVISDLALSELDPDTPLSSVRESPEAWIPVRWTLPLIQLATLVRQLVDDKLRNHGSDRLPFCKVEQAFCQLTDILPIGFRLDETYTSLWPEGGAPTAYEQRLSIERWILHQIIFATMLDFYEVRIGEPVSTQVIALSNHILDLQTRLRYRCQVVDSLRVNVDGVVRAVTLLCTDLMHKSHDPGASLTRQITRGRVREAMLRCQARSAATKADFEFVASLLDAEERLWNLHRHASASSMSIGSSSGVSAPLTPSSVDLTGAVSRDTIAQQNRLNPALLWPGAEPATSDISTASAAFSPAYRDARGWATELGELAQGDDMSDVLPKDSGICPALHTNTDMVDRLWEGVMAFLEKPLGPS